MNICISNHTDVLPQATGQYRILVGLGTPQERLPTGGCDSRVCSTNSYWRIWTDPSRHSRRIKVSAWCYRWLCGARSWPDAGPFLTKLRVACRSAVNLLSKLLSTPSAKWGRTAAPARNLLNSVRIYRHQNFRMISLGPCCSTSCLSADLRRSDKVFVELTSKSGFLLWPDLEGP